MRYVTLVLSPSDDAVQSSHYDEHYAGDVDPSEIWLDGTHIATQEAIQYVNLLNDGTVVAVVQFRGDAKRFKSMEDEIPEILSCTVTGGETWLAYMHYEPDELETTLYELVDTEAITVDWPVVETSEGVQVTLFGEDEALQEMIADIPDELDLDLKRAGEYQPNMDDPSEQLTDRQKEILRTAIAMGYYDIPRGASQRELADELSISRGTIGEHLRRAEAKIIQSVVV